MAEHSTPEERTELPTDRRMGDLRKKGSVHQSTEITLVVSLIASFYMLGIVWEGLYEGLSNTFVTVFNLIGERKELDYKFVENLAFTIGKYLALPMALIFVVSAFFGAMAVLLQTNFNIKEHKIEFRWDLLNPMTGFKRIFSINNFVMTLKAITKLALILPIAYYGLKEEANKMIQLVHLSIPKVMEFTASEIFHLFWKIMYILIAIAIFDWVWGKFQWLKTNKMTKEEVKDERKAIEGDETTKRQIIAKGLSRIMQRLKQSVPKADVIVTNPTHYAVALQYDRNSMKAPKVVAKGKNFMAERIKEIAREHRVPIMERKSLARALYHSVEVDKEIPVELFRATAEVLAYVYKLNRRQPTAAGATAS